MKGSAPRQGRGWPGYVLGGRLRTSTAVLLISFCAIAWLAQTYEPSPQPGQVPASEVVPPGFIPDPAYTWAPRTDVQRRSTETTTTTPTTPTTETSTTPTTPTTPTSATESSTPAEPGGPPRPTSSTSPPSTPAESTGTPATPEPSPVTPAPTASVTSAPVPPPR